MGLIPGNIAVSIILGLSLKKVWSAINVLQFLIYLQLWAITLPANTEKFVWYVAFIARGDFIPKNKIINIVLKMIGKPGNHADNNDSFTRFLIFIIVCIVIMSALIVILAFILKKYPSKLKGFVDLIWHQLFWNTFLRLCIQIYLDFSVQALMVTANFGNHPKKTVCMYAIAAVFFGLLPFCYFGLIKYNFNKVKEHDATTFRKIGTLFQGVKFNAMLPASYNVIFMVRRFLFAVFTAYMAAKSGAVGLVFVAWLNILQQVYLTHALPMDS